MDTGMEAARQRLSVLELAARLGNVAEACRRSGMDRTSFYEWRRRFQAQGFEGLRNLESHGPFCLPRVKTQEVTPALAHRIETLALDHAANDCRRIEALLLLDGVRVAASVIQEVLEAHGLGTAEHRWLALERRHAEGAAELSDDQVAFIERFNPAFRERHRESPGPGSCLHQDTLFIGGSGAVRLYLHYAVDTYSAYAFGFVHGTKQPEAAVALLYNEVLPLYRGLGFAIGSMETDGGPEFCGGDAHPFALYLALNDIEHLGARRGKMRSNGFGERFARIVAEEFLRGARHSGGSEPDADEMQAAFDCWLRHYNRERPYAGYRNYGHTPWAMMPKGAIG